MTLQVPATANGKDRFFSAEQGFVPSRLGQLLKDEAHVCRGGDARVWRYADGVYLPDGEDWSAQRVRELLEDRFRRRHWEEVKAWLKAERPTIGTQPDRVYLNLPNGLLDWRAGELGEHDPARLSTVRIPHRWEAAADCPRFQRFLVEVLPEDAVELVWEVIGYCLYPANPYQKAVMLLGPGGNGKSVLLRVIRGLLGAANVSVRSLHDLADDRFAPAELFGKLANVCGDLDARAVERSDLFKMVTSGEAISGQFKYGQAFNFVPHCKLLFSANEAPFSADQTPAYFDRWLIVPMTKRIRGTARDDPHLGERLASSQGELEGVLRRGVEALRRLMARGRFAVPASVQAAGVEFRKTLDTVEAFAEYRYRESPDGFVFRDEVYPAYRKWCEENGRRALSSSRVYARLLELYPTIRSSAANGRRGFKGLLLEVRIPELDGVPG